MVMHGKGAQMNGAGHQLRKIELGDKQTATGNNDRRHVQTHADGMKVQ